MFEEKDFEKLTYNVYKYRNIKTPILEKFPLANSFLKTFAEKCPPEIDFNTAFKYVVFMYDRKSPMLQIDDYFRRRKESCLLADFPTDKKGYLPKTYYEIAMGTNHYVKILSLWYCKLLGDITHTEYVMSLDDYYRERGHYQNEIDASKRTACLKNMEIAKQRIETLKQELLARDGNVELEICLNLDIIERELELAPENIAEKIAQDLDPLDGYNPSE